MPPGPLLGVDQARAAGAVASAGGPSAVAGRLAQEHAGQTTLTGRRGCCEQMGRCAQSHSLELGAE